MQTKAKLLNRPCKDLMIFARWELFLSQIVRLFSFITFNISLIKWTLEKEEWPLKIPNGDSFPPPLPLHVWLRKVCDFNNSWLSECCFFLFYLSNRIGLKIRSLLCGKSAYWRHLLQRLHESKQGTKLQL